MNILPDKYRGDDEMAELLKKAGSKISICGLYGLLYGILAAPHMVKPSQFYPLIFGEEGACFESEQDANTVLGNLMYLWNALAGCQPETDPLFFPEITYQDNEDGKKQRAKDDIQMVEYFMKGLDLGDTKENDFTDNAIKSMENLASVSILLAFHAGLNVLDNKEKSITSDDDTSLSIDQLEGIMADCIAEINLGLKDARIRVVGEMRDFADAQQKAYQAKSIKVPRNEPCRCGSGKKYKKCCGLTH